MQPPTSTSTSVRGKLERCGTDADDDSVRGDGAFTDFSCNEDESDTDWQAKVGLELERAQARAREPGSVLGP